MRPADVCSPQRDAIRHKHVEQPDIQHQPVVAEEGLAATVGGLEKDYLRVDHRPNHQEVVASHRHAELSDEAAALNVVQGQQEEDRELHPEARPKPELELVHISSTRVNALRIARKRQHQQADHSEDHGANDHHAAEGLHAVDFKSVVVDCSFCHYSVFN